MTNDDSDDDNDGDDDGDDDNDGDDEGRWPQRKRRFNLKRNDIHPATMSMGNTKDGDILD